VKAFSRSALIVLAAVVVAFAIYNRGVVTVDFGPVPWRVDVPLYLLILATLFIGFMIGAIVIWLSQGRWRRRARARAREAEALGRELSAVKERLAEAKASAARSSEPATAVMGTNPPAPPPSGG